MIAAYYANTEAFIQIFEVPDTPLLFLNTPKFLDAQSQKTGIHKPQNVVRDSLNAGPAHPACQTKAKCFMYLERLNQVLC